MQVEVKHKKSTSRVRTVLLSVMASLAVCSMCVCEKNDFDKRIPMVGKMVEAQKQKSPVKLTEETPPRKLLIDIDRIGGSREMTDAERNKLKADIISQLSALQKSNRSDLVVKSLKSLCRYLPYEIYLKPLETMKKEDRKKMPYPIARSIFREFPREAVITLSTLMMSDICIAENMVIGATLILKDIYNGEKYPKAKEEIRDFLSIMLSGENVTARMSAITTVVAIPVRELYTLTEFSLLNLSISLIPTDAMKDTNNRKDMAEVLSGVRKAIETDRAQHPELQPPQQHMPLMMFKDLTPVIEKTRK